MASDPGYHSLKIAAVVDETPDTRSFVLEIPPALEDEFHYAAGQFSTFRATLEGERVVRSYSMSSSPDVGDPFTVTVKRVPGGRMSNWMNDALAPGDLVEVMRPTGLFVLRDTEVPLVAFAGGSGITPILSLLKSALATTRRSLSLVYANRDAEHVIFAAELQRLREAAGGRLALHPHLDSEGGFLDAATCAELAGERADADFYVCGPAPFMEVVETGLAQRGVGAEQLFIERFEIDEREAGAAEAEAEPTESVTIRLEGRKQTVAYRKGDTLLETARGAGLSPPFSCEAGNCASCMARLEQGAARMHVNNALSAEEVAEGWVLTCQAVPTGRVVVVDYDA